MALEGSLSFVGQSKHAKSPTKGMYAPPKRRRTINSYRDLYEDLRQRDCYLVTSLGCCVVPTSGVCVFERVTVVWLLFVPTLRARKRHAWPALPLMEKETLEDFQALA